MESNSEHTHATTIPSPEDMTLRASDCMSKLVGAWPFLFVRPSLLVRCTLDMALGTQLQMARAVVANLDKSRKAFSFASVEVKYELGSELSDYVLCRNLV